MQKKRLDFLQEKDNLKLTNLKLEGNVTNAGQVYIMIEIILDDEF